MKYQPVVGLEIHLQLKTKTKMFSRSRSNYFNEEPNTHIDPVSFGLPGALPVPNKVAFEKAVKLAIALNCKINPEVHFDRKNYFYPDLPKGYQISQFDKPIGEEGYVEIEINDDSRRIRIIRMHLEEDTGKSIHSETGETYLDYNKSGVPLAEIVTSPDFESVEEVLAFAKRLRQIVRYVDASDAEMQKGQMRFELNISVREIGDKNLPNYKVEVKNIGSISVLEKVLNYEFKRQSELLEKGEKIKNQTRGLKDMTGETVFQRSKESSDDYRYFPEPDIPPIKIREEQISKFKSELTELPHERKQRFVKLGLNPEQAEIFVEDIERGDFFDKTIKEADKNSFNNYKAIAALINTEIVSFLEKNKVEIKDIKLLPIEIIEILKLSEENKITANVAKQVISKILEQNSEHSESTVDTIISNEGLSQMSDSSEIDSIIMEVINANTKVVEDIKKNPNAIKFLVGQVMRLSKGKINPNTAEEKLKEKIPS